MDKRNRNMKPPATPVSPHSPTGSRKERRPSMFEKEAYTQLLKERLKDSIHDVLYVEPPFDESIAEISKEWKSSMGKFRFANTYRLEPQRKFQAHSVEMKVQQILTENLKEVKYDDKLFSHLSLELADLILTAVKDFAFQRYKLIIKVSSRWIWDTASDTWIAAKHETETYVALALVFGLYCE